MKNILPGATTQQLLTWAMLILFPRPGGCRPAWSHPPESPAPAPTRSPPPPRSRPPARPRSESRCGAQLGDVAQPAADSLKLLVDVDCLAAPAEHGRQVRLALLLEPLHHHEPLHGALDEVLGAADLTGGLLVLVVVLRHLLAHELVAEPLAVHLADHASERGSTSRNSCSVIVAPHSWATISGLFSLNSPLSPSQWIPSLCFLSVSRSRP